MTALRLFSPGLWSGLFLSCASHPARVRLGLFLLAEQEAFAAPAFGFAHQLAQIPLAALTRVGGACVAQVRVVRPDDDARGPTTLLAQVAVQLLKRVHHVPVAQVP